MSLNDLFAKIGVKKDKKSLDLTTTVKKPSLFTKIKDNITLKQYANYSADLLFLPTTKKEHRYLLIVVDLSTDLFDMEPLKDKEALGVLEAFKKMFRREYIKAPTASVTTDGGTEFAGEFATYLYNLNVFKKTTVPGRHTQNSTVESLNRQMGRLLNGYMNTKEVATGKRFNEWDKPAILKIIRVELNKHRKKSIPTAPQYKWPDTLVKQKFNVGDIVHPLLDRPKDALGQTMKDEKFRSGDYRWDPVPKKIVRVFNYVGEIPFRYKLEGIDKVSYTPAQLKLSTSGETASQFEVKTLLEKKKIRNKIHYLVWWKNYPKTDSTWEPVASLKEDGFGPHIQEFNKNNKNN